MSEEPEAPSPFVVAQRERLAATAALGPCLDLACGSGRHARLAARGGLRVVALDRDPGALRAVAASARAERLPIAPLLADAEVRQGLPLAAGSCGGVVVTRFLWRPLANAISALLAPGGLLVYETFTRRQPELGWGPKNPAFLLGPGELTALFRGLEVLEHVESLRSGGGADAWLAGLVARRAG